ncbi:13406_t:CDS:2 [Ambispora leptoticha]|uniref:13406_t:CDS:1 n=1 Tax=Ambispora leptoticha TaxID=144679 RepID=A0A9N8W5T3_9GLOM|nr:13406_t:CDS:2 [Ambispora leptoticha]
MPHAIEQNSTSTYAHEHFLSGQQLNNAVTSVSDARNNQLAYYLFRQPGLESSLSEVDFGFSSEEQNYDLYDQNFSEGIKTSSSSCDVRKMEEGFLQDFQCCGIFFGDFHSLITHKQVMHLEFMGETGPNLENTYGLIAEEGWSSASVSSAGSIPNSVPHSPQEDPLQAPAHLINYIEQQPITDKFPETSISVNLQDIRVFGQLNNNRSHNNNNGDSEQQGSHTGNVNQVAMARLGQTRRSATDNVSTIPFNLLSLFQPQAFSNSNHFNHFPDFQAVSTRTKRAASFSCMPAATILDNSEYINNNDANYGRSGVMTSNTATSNRGAAPKSRRNTNNESQTLQQRHNQLDARLTASAPATPTTANWPQASSNVERENFNIGGPSSMAAMVSGQVSGEQRRLSAPSLSTPLSSELSLASNMPMSAATSLMNDNSASSDVYGYSVGNISAVALSSIYPMDQRGMKRNREDGTEMDINQKRMSTETTFWDVNENLGNNTSMMTQKSSKKRAVTAESARRKVSKSLGGPIAVATTNVPVVIDSDAISISASLTNAIPAGVIAQPLPPPQVETDKPYRCAVEGCQKTYKNANGLKYHRTHGHNTEQSGNGDKSAEKPYKCQHVGCPKSYKNLNGLKYHLEHNHNGVTSPSLGGGSSSGVTGV